MGIFKRRQKNAENRQRKHEHHAAPSAEDEDFINDSSAAMLAKTTPVTHLVLYSLLVVLFAGLIWAYFAKIEQITVGVGKVIPSSEDKIIQSLDGGIITDILVHEGQIVQKGQVLIRLDDTRYKAEYSSAQDRYLALSATVARLTAEAQGSDSVDFPSDIKLHPEIMNPELNLFITRKKALHEELDALQQSYDTAEKQTKMYESLLPKGYVSQLEYLRSLQNAEDFKTKIIDKQNEFIEQVRADLAKNKADLDSLIDELKSLQDKMVRTTIRSPTYGIINKINVVTVGGVVTPGSPIMEIVPLTDTLLVQARIKPSDIAFVSVGQPATVKITAYDFSIYGGIPGTVDYVSADTVPEEKLQDPTQQENPALESPGSYYLVNIKLSRNYLGGANNKLYIMPGMVATVHIQTGEKTILQYILKPLIKAKEEALRER